jgi:hypothetical protein
MTDINVALLQKVLDYITEHPEEHDQSIIAKRTLCGTAACVAGHTVAMTGHILNWSITGQAYTCDSGRENILDVAATELGLTYDQSSELFSADNTLAQLWLIASVFTEGAVEIPAGVVA